MDDDQQSRSSDQSSVSSILPTLVESEMQDDNKPCAVCNKPDALACPDCKSISYCSKGCRARDWRIHKTMCHSYAHDAHERPTPEAKRAIYFSEYAAEPQFTWIAPFKNIKDSSRSVPGYTREGQVEIINIGTLLSIDSSEIDGRTLTGRTIEGRCVKRNTAVIWLKKQTESDPVNHTICAMTGWRKLPRRWTGPFLAYGLDDEQNDIKDLSPAELNDILDFLLKFGSGEGHQSFDPSGTTLRENRQMIDAVMIACEGDHRCRGLPLFSRIKIPDTHAVFKLGKKSNIAENFGQPLCSIRSPTPDLQSDYTCNSLASGLHRSLKIANDGFGMPEDYWMDLNGNVIVARTDQEPLDVDYVKMLCIWCVTSLEEGFQHNLEDSWAFPIKEHVNLRAELVFEETFKMKTRLKMLPKISKEEFDAFAVKWNEKTPEKRDEDLERLSVYGRLLYEREDLGMGDLRIA